MKSDEKLAIEFEAVEPKENWFQTWFPFLRWIPTSSTKLRDAEKRFIDFVKTPSEGFYVNVGKIIDQVDCKIWTRKFQNPEMDKGKEVPIVMLHGMGAGLAMFALNIDDLAKDRVVYAIDLPGFGRSSRPGFSSDPEEVETQYIACIEEWRQKVGLGRVILYYLFSPLSRFLAIISLN